MSHRHTPFSPIGSFEQLESRNLMSVSTVLSLPDTSDIAAQVQTTLEGQQMRPRMVYGGVGDAEKFWGAGSPGEAAINNQRQLVSAAEFVPTPASPLTMHIQFSIQGKAGVVVATRTEGAANQNYEKEYERGVVFTVEYNGMSAYQYDPTGGTYVIPYAQFPRLEDGAMYDLTIEDKGTQAHVRLEREGQVIVDQTGEVKRQTGLGGIVLRKQDPNPQRRLDVSALSIAHGQEPVPRPVEATPAPASVSPSLDKLPSAKIDEVFGNFTRLMQEWEESKIQAIKAEPSSILYSTEGKEAFWDGVTAGTDVDLNDRQQLLSARDIVPTAEDPLSLRMQFSIQGKAGVVAVTRTDGVASGRMHDEYKQGLVTTVEYNGMSVYHYDPAGGTYVIPYVQFPRLEDGALYDLVIEDSGTQAHVRLEREGTVILDQTGTITKQTSLGRIVLRKQSENPAVRLDVSSLAITHNKGSSLEAAAAIAPSSTVERGDARLALISSMDYGNPVLTSGGRAQLFAQSRFASDIDKRAILARHPSYGGGNGGVDRDLQNELEYWLGIYQDVVGDMLTRGMEVRLNELKGISTQKPMEMIHWITANRWKVERRAQYFGLELPSVNQILDESAKLFDGNLNRMIDYQEAIRQQEWNDTHLGETARKAKDPTESRQIEANKERLKEAMIETAKVIANYKSDVRREFEMAVAHSRMKIEEVYIAAGVDPQPKEEVLSTETEMTWTALRDEFGYTGEQPEGISSLEEPLQFGDRIEDRITQTVRIMIANHPEGWWSRSTSTPNEPGTFVRSDTSAGALYHGISQQLWSVKDAILQKMIAEKSATLLGMPAAALVSIDRSSPAAFARGLRRVFTDGGYGHLFTTSSTESSTQASVLHPRVDGHIFVNGEIPVHWDAATGGKQVARTSVYLVDNMTTQHQASQTPLAETQGLDSYARIPVEKIGMNGENIGFKIAVWFTDGTTAGGYVENPFVVAWDGRESGTKSILGRDFSTLSENDPNKKIEDAILTQLADHFPFKNPQEWKQTIGSGFHLGDGSKAIDLNLRTGENTDYGAPIYAIANGKIVGRPNPILGAITLEHTILVNGQSVKWQSRYLHLPIEQEGDRFFVRERENMASDGKILYEKEIAESMAFAEDEQLAVVGKNDTQLSHLHLDILSPEGKHIDGHRVLADRGVISKATDSLSREWTVVWSETEHSWINEEYGIMFVQNANTWTNGQDNVWVPLDKNQDGREQVIYREKDGVWVNERDPNQRWDPLIRAWEIPTQKS